MPIRFSKMQALGNDFVVLDGVRQALNLDAVLCRRLADRRLGIGCDQILVVDPSPAAGIDFGFRIFNADGSEVGQCGNGARAVARFIAREGLADAPALRLATATTSFRTERHADGRVSVELPPPRLAPADIPLARETAGEDYPFRLGDTEIRVAAVGLGNPHAVLLVDDLATAPVDRIGQALGRHPDFPEGVNVGFAHIRDRGHIELRVHERGVGETPACGSGACAAMVAARRWGRVDAQATVALPGGMLDIAWSGPDAPIRMTGPAEFVFEGEIEP